MREITDIKEIQQISLNILKFIDKVCKENNIQYFLAGGTALGAVRHKGFIPWDDDIDIMMTRPNYNKFLEIMDNTPNDKYKALHFGKNFPNYFYGFTKVSDLETKLYEANYINNDDLGISVDIFAIDGAPQNIKSIFKKYQRLRALQDLASLKRFHKSPNGILKTLIKFGAYLYAKFFGWKHWSKKKIKILKQCNFEENNKSMLFDGVYGLREIMDKDIYNHVIYLPFEDSKFPVLKDYDTYLSSIYGDYMTPPPKEKQITHSFKCYKK